MYDLLVRAVGVQLLEEADGVVDHVRALGELILRGLDLLDGEEVAVDEVGEEGKDQMAVAVGDDGLCQVVFRHRRRVRDLQNRHSDQHVKRG